MDECDYTILVVGSGWTGGSADALMDEELDLLADEVYGDAFREGEPARFLLANDGHDGMAGAAARWAAGHPRSAALAVDLPEPMSREAMLGLWGRLPGERLDLCLACPCDSRSDTRTWSVIRAASDAGVEVRVL